jgi:methyl-accepting chemotaxis protein
LCGAEVERLGKSTQLALAVQPLGTSEIPADFSAAMSLVSDEMPVAVEALTPQTVAGYTLLNDIYGKPALILRVAMPRKIYGQGEATISYFVGSILAICVLFGSVSILLLESRILSRVTGLSQNIAEISSSGDLSKRVSVSGKDELSDLASTTNEMLERLEQTAKEREAVVKELQEALGEIGTLRDMIPICASCKKVRDDEGYWHKVEDYLQHHAKVRFSHGLCEECTKTLYPDVADELFPPDDSSGG